MKKLFLISLVVFSTISLMTSCGEKSSTKNATEEVKKECCDSTKNSTCNVVDSVEVK
jgi:hypothetical protein